jgi:hypothetical protein
LLVATRKLLRYRPPKEAELSSTRQQTFQFDTGRKQELPEEILQRCRELMVQMLLAVVTAPRGAEEESKSDE